MTARDRSNWIPKVGVVYVRAKLIANDNKDITVRPSAKVWITATLSQTDQIKLLIRASNLD